MKNNFTNDSLIQFIYKECSAREAAQIKKEIMSNDEFAVEYHQLRAAVDNLDAIDEQPSQTSIDIILNYAMESVEHE
jgi:hypothetical protein